MYQYIKTDNPTAADEFIKNMTDTLFNLAELELQVLHAIGLVNRCFYFRIMDDAMIVVRVLHERQDVNAQEFPFN